MITIFTVPKPFRGHIGQIQRNAIESWVNLDPGCEVILFGDEEGTQAVASEFGARHCREIKRNEYGTPLLNDVFEKAHGLATHDVLAFVNCDIVLLRDFRDAVARVREFADRFLMIGKCWNLQISVPLRFDDDWQPRLRSEIRRAGKSRGMWYIDFFVFPKNLYPEIPPFVIGRAGFDNWLVWRARTLQVPVIDVTPVVAAIHQHHDYAHVPGGRAWSYFGKEAQHNMELAGGRQNYYTISDASHKLYPKSIRPHLGARWRVKYRAHSAFIRVLRWTRPVRHAMGLRETLVDKVRLFARRWRPL